MHKLYDLKTMLCEELEEYGSKGKLDVGSLDVVDKLAHAVKNIDKIIEAKEDEGYSGDMMSYDGGMSYEGRGRLYRGGRSYARGRRNARRDSMGRYSGAEDDFMMELKELMADAPNEHIRKKMEAIVDM